MQSLHTLKIRDLEMTIGELETQMKDDQNNWLRLQSHIVEMSQKMSMQLNDSHIARQRESLYIYLFIDCIDSDINILVAIICLLIRIVGDRSKNGTYQ